MASTHKPKKIPNRKGRATPAGVTIKGLPPDILSYLKAGAHTVGATIGAYTRAVVVDAVRIRMASTIEHTPPGGTTFTGIE